MGPSPDDWEKSVKITEGNPTISGWYSCNYGHNGNSWGALYWNKIGSIVFGAYDEKNSYRRVTEKNPFHPSTVLIGGILQDECGALMSQFFKNKR